MPKPVVNNPIKHIKTITLVSTKIEISKAKRHNREITNPNIPAKNPPKAIFSEPIALEVTTEDAKKKAPIKATIFPKFCVSDKEFWNIIISPITKVISIKNICFGSFSFKNSWLKTAENIGDIDNIRRLEATEEFKIEKM